MRPSPDEILTSVIASYEEHVLPAVEEPFARSVALTIANLLRHVQLRHREEGPALMADNDEVRTLLAQIVAFADQHDLPDLRDGAASGLTEQPSPHHPFVGLEVLLESATALRWTLQHSIRRLEALRPSLGDREAYVSLRQEIRRYLRRSLEREMSTIVPAFTGERR